MISLFIVTGLDLSIQSGLFSAVRFSTALHNPRFWDIRGVKPFERGKPCSLCCFPSPVWLIIQKSPYVLPLPCGSSSRQDRIEKSMVFFKSSSPHRRSKQRRSYRSSYDVWNRPSELSMVLSIYNRGLYLFKLLKSET
uniref:Uncharacterized protein n=1 Tax=Picea glauca TaxID=3330 RepID=A0A101M2C8_PICGL|nr:hypothetical protein ABT39_MTgene2874 [Picea glauca]